MARYKGHVFGITPNVSFRRSAFDMSYRTLTSMNMGELIPTYVQSVVPGDSFKLTDKALIRMSSALIKPIMDNIYMDTYYFFVPYRLCYKDFEKVVAGSEPDDYSAYPTEYKVPTFSGGVNESVSSGSLGDYFGFPLGEMPTGVSLLKFRAYALVWNYWFRNENIENSVDVSTGNQTSNEKMNNNPWSVTNYTGRPAPVSKFHDYFTTCLPNTQKGGSVPLPLRGSLLDGNMPIVSNPNLSATSDALQEKHGVVMPYWYQVDGKGNIVAKAGGSLGTGKGHNVFVNEDSNFGFDPTPAAGDTTDNALMGASLEGDLSAITSTVNDLRLAFQKQKYLERLAIAGGRYQEYLKGMFGVTGGDARLQVPELLGGKRIRLNVTQVEQTSEGTNESPLANLAGYSQSFGKSGFSKSFTEFGVILGLSCIRQEHTYQQGYERDNFRSKRFDFYNPLFAHIGEQPVYTKELYFAHGQDEEEIFGYNEAFADMRYRPNQVSGQMRSAATNSFDIWHLADNYNSAPTLTGSFLNETPIYLDRALAAESTQGYNQFLLDIEHENRAVRVLPTYGTPGLIDHM